VRAPAKLGLVTIGYVGAFAIASAAVMIHMVATSGQGSDGMLAFGDSVLFLVVFGVAAVPATAAALYFLRPYPTLWRVLAGSALALGVTGVAALLVYLADQTAAPGSTIQLLGGLALLRTIVAPLFALTFLLSGLFAPDRPERIALFAATMVEALVFGGALLLLLRPLRGY
jgi:hypothetical protein